MKKDGEKVKREANLFIREELDLKLEAYGAIYIKQTEHKLVKSPTDREAYQLTNRRQFSMVYTLIDSKMTS